MWNMGLKLTIRSPSRDRFNMTTPARRAQRPRGERGRRWQQLLDEGAYPSRAALARAEGVSRAAVTQALARLYLTGD